MRKVLLLGAALLLVTAAPSASVAQKASKGGPEFVGDAINNIFVPGQSLAGQTAAPAKATKAKKAKRSKKKSARKSKMKRSKAKKKS